MSPWLNRQAERDSVPASEKRTTPCDRPEGLGATSSDPAYPAKHSNHCCHLDFVISEKEKTDNHGDHSTLVEHSATWLSPKGSCKQSNPEEPGLGAPVVLMLHQKTSQTTTVPKSESVGFTTCVASNVFDIVFVLFNQESAGHFFPSHFSQRRKPPVFGEAPGLEDLRQRVRHCMTHGFYSGELTVALKQSRSRRSVEAHPKTFLFFGPVDFRPRQIPILWQTSSEIICSPDI